VSDEDERRLARQMAFSDSHGMLNSVSNARNAAEGAHSPSRILVIEDDKDIARLVELHLKDSGYQVTLSFDGDDGVDKALSGSFDLIVLDLSLPGVDGLEICRRVRAASVYTPVLVLSSRSSERERVLGLETGADDYLTKPFSVPEFLARVKALFRRMEALKPDSSRGSEKIIRAGGDLLIDSEKRNVIYKGHPVILTAKEFDLLLHFARHPGRVFTRSELLNLVWGYGYEGYEHTVNSHINRLRAKIENDPAKPRHILTVWGIGYKFADTQEG
jgi:DNA-binding response OmpR family regulator